MSLSFAAKDMSVEYSSPSATISLPPLISSSPASSEKNSEDSASKRTSPKSDILSPPIKRMKKEVKDFPKAGEEEGDKKSCLSILSQLFPPPPLVDTTRLPTVKEENVVDSDDNNN